MSPAVWTAIRDAFQQVLEAPGAERPSRIAALPPGIRDEVLSLLAAHEESATGFIDRGRQPMERERLGPYRLIEKLGEGGMGVVYRAERDDGEFRRQVAIKITSGRLFAPEAERRFLHERQILAQLDHPHIVRMLDGGVEQNRRYLVMEYVDGEPIDQHCARLPLAARLELFRQVCSAMHCAHQSLVIHRDLKPANILITSAGEAKVLDFGIAKLLDEDFGASTMLQPMSLRCASPEQARGDRLTAATDIYALGLLLYELISGRNPQDPREGETREGLLRRIVEDDPPRPGADPDLDAVAMKALDRDPARRYASAAELGEEIRRYLSGEGVLARVPGIWTRVGRQLRRHKAASALAAALVLATFGGTAAAAWQAREARLQRELAERRFNDARRLIHTVLQEVNPRLMAINGTLPTRKLLVEAASQYYERLSQEMNDNPGLAAESIVAYHILARASGAEANSSNLGQREEGEKLQKKGIALADRLLKRYPDHPELLRAAIRAMGDLPEREQRQRALELAERLLRLKPDSFEARDAAAAAAFMLASTVPVAEKQRLLERSRSIWEAEIPRAKDQPRLLRNTALAYKNLSGVAQSAGQRLEYALRAYEYDRRVLELQPESPEAQLDVAIDLSMISTGYEHSGDMVKASHYMQQSARLREKVYAANPEDIRALDRLVYALSRAGVLAGPAEAQPLLERALALGQRLRSRQPWNPQIHAWQVRAALALAALSPQPRRCELTRQANDWLRALPAGSEPGVINAQIRLRAAACR